MSSGRTKEAGQKVLPGAFGDQYPFVASSRRPRIRDELHLHTGIGMMGVLVGVVCLPFWD